MLKKLFIATLLFSSTAAFAQQKTTDKAAMAIAVPAETIKVSEDAHDFGKIPQGKPVTTFFTITNTGKTPMKIDNIHAGCGCTTPEWEKDKTLAPGESTKVKVGYNAGNIGSFNKNVDITYNGDQKKQIFIKGEVFTTPSDLSLIHI